jgi:hypothetical protein
MRNIFNPRHRQPQLRFHAGLPLKSLLGATLAGTTVLPAWMPMSPLNAEGELLHQVQGKTSKASARCRDRPNVSQQCSGCTHFRSGQCQIVEGQISPNGWCRHFKSKGGSDKGDGKSSGGIQEQRRRWWWWRLRLLTPSRAAQVSSTDRSFAAGISPWKTA